MIRQTRVLRHLTLLVGGTGLERISPALQRQCPEYDVVQIEKFIECQRFSIAIARTSISSVISQCATQLRLYLCFDMYLGREPTP